jgi:hypothetical protein
LADEGRYAAAAWSHERRVVYQAAARDTGRNLRFVVTSRTDLAPISRRSRADLAPLALCTWYVRRGEPERWIKDRKDRKDRKDAGFADRLSGQRFGANQLRWLLHAAAYWLRDTVRRLLVQAGIARMQLDTLRLRLVKIGGWVREQVHSQLQAYQIHLARSHPGAPLWRLLAARFPLRE